MLGCSCRVTSFWCAGRSHTTKFRALATAGESVAESELTDVTAKAVIHEAFVEGRLEAPKHLARTVHDLYFEPRYEGFRPRTIWSLAKCFHFCIEKPGADPAVRGPSHVG